MAKGKLKASKKYTCSANGKIKNPCDSYNNIQYCGEGIEGLGIESGDDMDEMLEKISDTIQDNSGETTEWGGIEGDISNQEDLREVLDEKVSVEREVKAEGGLAGGGTLDGDISIHLDDSSIESLKNADDAINSIPLFFKSKTYSSTGEEDNRVSLNIGVVPNLYLEHVQITPCSYYNTDNHTYVIDSQTVEYSDETGYLTFTVKTRDGNDLPASKTLMYDITVYKPNLIT